MSTSEPAVTLDPGLDAKLAAAVYARAGRVQLAGALGRECAERTLQCLVSEVPWQLHFNDGDRTYDLVDGQVEELPDADRVLLLKAIHAKAGRRFQYLFNNFSVSDAYEAGLHRELYVMRVLEFLNSPSFLTFARAVTGVHEIAVVDAQATLYRPGHFLTCHDDLVPGKHRAAAYVISLSPDWVTDWGGILNFLDPDGQVAEGYTPRFNTLNLFRVPQRHAVSYVTPFAQAGRYSISGWLREA